MIQLIKDFFAKKQTIYFFQYSGKIEGKEVQGTVEMKFDDAPKLITSAQVQGAIQAAKNHIAGTQPPTLKNLVVSIPFALREQKIELTKNTDAGKPSKEDRST